jgi:hypothetical protein
LHGLPDFSWHDGHDLLAYDARLHGKDDDHPVVVWLWASRFVSARVLKKGTKKLAKADRA